MVAFTTSALPPLTFKAPLAPFTVIVLVFLWIWWRAGVERYLRIAESRRIVLAMLAMAFLTAAILVLAVPAYSQDVLLGFWF